MSINPIKYLELLGLNGADDVVKRIADLTSDLSEQQHQVRSSIFDLHAALHLELRRIFYHIFKPMLFIDRNDEAQSARVEKSFNERIGKLGYMETYRVLEPIFLSWPLGDLDTFIELDRTRNQIAHGSQTTDIRYRKRNPFDSNDCFAQMYFDVWAAQQAVAKFFDLSIEEPRARLHRYQEKFGFGH